MVRDRIIKTSPAYYRISEILKRIDRSKTTLLRMEVEGKIPKARRDSRGWRYYSVKDVEKNIEIIESMYKKGRKIGEK